MNKMKPEDVMRALEKHADYESDNCFECPYKSHLSTEVGNCVDHLVRAALALLLEKDAEIERLKNEIEQEKRNCRMTQHLLKNAYESIEKKDKRTETIRAEAITEFAERLKYTLCVNNEENTDFFDYSYTLETIDQMAKKMKEKQNESKES